MCKLDKLIGSSEHEELSVHGLYGVQNIKGIRFGIELELEGCEIEFGQHENLSKWTVVEDGSLRNNGREFVSRILRPSDMDKALQELEEVFSQFPQTHASFRCGTHIHYNVSDRSLKEAIGFLIISLLFESVLVAAFSPERRESVFCVSWSDTVGLSSIIRRWRSGNYANAIAHAISNSGKYRTINILPMQRYGTIEFRMFPSTTDTKELKTFVEVLVRIDNLYKELGLEKTIERVVNGPAAALSYVFDGVRIKTSMKDMLKHFSHDLLHILSATTK